jgi:hypothetical protein
LLLAHLSGVVFLLASECVSGERVCGFLYGDNKAVRDEGIRARKGVSKACADFVPPRRLSCAASRGLGLFGFHESFCMSWVILFLGILRAEFMRSLSWDRDGMDLSLPGGRASFARISLGGNFVGQIKPPQLGVLGRLS